MVQSDNDRAISEPYLDMFDEFCDFPCDLQTAFPCYFSLLNIYLGTWGE